MSQLLAVFMDLKMQLVDDTYKKGEKIVEDLTSKNFTSLEAYAGVTGNAVDTVKFINFATRSIAGMGVEPKLNAYISLAKINELNAPVAGTNGVYVFKVYNREKSAEEYNEKNLIEELNQANLYKIGYGLSAELVKMSEIKDNRIRFY